MDGEVWRPIASGLVGGLIGTGITRMMRHRLAESFNGRNIGELVVEYRWHIRFCGAFFLGSLVAAIASYRWLGSSSHDWRPLLTGFGGGVFLPVALVYLRLPRTRFEEFWVAYAAKEGCAPWLLTALLVLSSIGFFVGLSGFLWK